MTTAEGDKAAAVLRAEGERQRQILQAQGDAEATRQLAEAERFRQLTVAEGEARAITTVYQAIHAGDPSPDLLAIKYLEALGRIANGQATKIFLPADFSSGLGALGAVAELFAGAGDGDGDDARAQRAETARSDLDHQLAETQASRQQGMQASAQHEQAAREAAAQASAQAAAIARQLPASDPEGGQPPQPPMAPPPPRP